LFGAEHDFLLLVNTNVWTKEWQEQFVGWGHSRLEDGDTIQNVTVVVRVIA